MKKLKKLLLVVIFLFLVGLGFIVFKYPYLLKGVTKIYLQGHTTSYISDLNQYPKRMIENGEIQQWPLHKNYNRAEETERLKQTNEKYGTVAFLVIKNDSILFEKYYQGYHRDSLSNSFSMAKSIVMSLIFKAIQDGYIKSLDQKLMDFFPEIQGPYAHEVTIRDVAEMTAGTNWIEDYYNPFNITAEAYFTDDLDNLILKRVKFVEKPGEKWYYSSGNTQILGMLVKRATGKNLSEYLSESFWKLMGMRKYAWWSLDRKDGMEKAYCCIYSNARDFSKFGKLYMQQGNWNGKQLIDSSLVKQALTPVSEEMPRYGLQWWLFEHDEIKGYMMRGHLGQYVIVIPEKNLIITRLGQSKPKSPMGTFSKDIWVYLEEGMKIAEELQ